MGYYVPPRFDLFEFDDELLGATSGIDEPPEFARLSAAHLALGGTALPVPDRPGSTKAVVREVERISTTVGVRPDQFRARKVTDWEVYDLDAVAAPGPAS